MKKNKDKSGKASGLKAVNLKRAHKGLTAAQYHTNAGRKSEDKARAQMMKEQPNIYPPGIRILSNDVRRFMAEKKRLKKSNGSMFNTAACATLCKACDQKDKCKFLRAIYNRKCTVQANHALVAKMVDPTEPKGKKKHTKMLADYYRWRKAIPVSDTAWEKKMLPGVLNKAAKLYEACASNLDFARLHIEHTAMRSEANKLPWDLSTVLKEIGDSK